MRRCYSCGEEYLNQVGAKLLDALQKIVDEAEAMHVSSDEALALVAIARSALNRS